MYSYWCIFITRVVAAAHFHLGVVDPEHPSPRVPHVGGPLHARHVRGPRARDVEVALPVARVETCLGTQTTSATTKHHKTPQNIKKHHKTSPTSQTITKLYRTSPVSLYSAKYNSLKIEGKFQSGWSNHCNRLSLLHWNICYQYHYLNLFVVPILPKGILCKCACYEGKQQQYIPLVFMKTFCKVSSILMDLHWRWVLCCHCCPKEESRQYSNKKPYVS